MIDDKRYERVRGLVRECNRARKKQTKQIDVLCNGLIGAQRSFMHRLDEIAFAAGFYEAIVGRRNVDELLAAVGGFVRAELGELGLSIFVRRASSFEVHSVMLESDKDGREFVDAVSEGIAQEVCENSRVMGLEELPGLGLEYDPVRLGRLSGYCVPVRRGMEGAGFVIVTGKCGQLKRGDAGKIEQVGTGLLRALESCEITMGS